QIPLTVRAVLTASSAAGRFGLRPDQQLPANAFMSLKTIQDRLGLAGREASPRDPHALPARVNAIFVAARHAEDAIGAGALTAASEFDRLLSLTWQPADFHLRLVPNEIHQYL